MLKSLMMVTWFDFYHEVLTKLYNNIYLLFFALYKLIHMKDYYPISKLDSNLFYFYNNYYYKDLLLYNSYHLYLLINFLKILSKGIDIHFQLVYNKYIDSDTSNNSRYWMLIISSKMIMNASNDTNLKLKISLVSADQWYYPWKK